jgi:hypothetical protein
MAAGGEEEEGSGERGGVLGFRGEREKRPSED